jgi:hypothetical protein
MSKKKTALDYALEQKIPSVLDLGARIVEIEKDIVAINELFNHCVFYPEDYYGKENPISPNEK